MKTYIHKLVSMVKNAKIIFIGITVVLIFYFCSGYVKSFYTVRSFYTKYDVLTVEGDNLFSLKKIQLNGNTVEGNEEGWTNVLPVPNTLKYVLLTSSYSKGRTIQCGNISISKRVEDINLGENEWCIKHNGKYISAISSTQYYYYDENNIVYETCLKSGYYQQSNDKTRSYNGCAERALFFNDKQIAVEKEKMEFNRISGKYELNSASSFNFEPSKRLYNSIIYSTDKGAYVYDITSEKITKLSDNLISRLDDIFITKEGKTIAVEEFYTENSAFAIFGKMTFGDNVYTNVYSANYIDGHMYILRFTDIQDKENGSGKTVSYELIRDGKKVENIQLDTINPYGYETRAIQQFPKCVTTTTIVCVYENGHYAYKNRVMEPDVFSYGFYINSMVIDGEWMGGNIPDLIGTSKPIFENNKLKYIFYISPIGEGSYLIDFDKKWTFKELYSKTGSATTKLFGGNQNLLLNVIAK